jgi:hypothetical protein
MHDDVLRDAESDSFLGHAGIGTVIVEFPEILGELFQVL